MPNRLPPRPCPSEETITLLRRPKSGFVVYPKYVPKRMINGRARYMTGCDMLVGPCACGYTHNEHEDWVREILQYHNLCIEPLILWGEKQQRGMVVEIPGYWKQYRDWRRSRCDVLVGKCACGRTHSIQENWVKKQLRLHGAVILNLPQPEDADVSNVRPNIQTYRAAEPVSLNSHQIEDRVHRRGDVPINSNGYWWTAEDNSPEVDIEPFRSWNLPLEYQEIVNNAEGVMENCDCSACEARRQQVRDQLLQEWVTDAQVIRDNGDSDEIQAWGNANCNDTGNVPFFCNCESCTVARLRMRNTSPQDCVQEGSLTFEIPTRFDESNLLQQPRRYRRPVISDDVLPSDQWFNGADLSNSYRTERSNG